MYDREALKQLVRDKALKFGDFTLASGKQANFYLDCRQITLDAQGVRLVGEGMLDLLAGNMPAPGRRHGDRRRPDHRRDPHARRHHATCRSAASWSARKPKQHGTGKLVEGPFQPGESIAIVEDVVTTGGSSL